MDIETIRSFLGWCAVMNMGILLYWMAFLLVAPNWTYRFQGRWIEVTEEQFKSMHFLLMGWFKLTIFFFNIVPYFALGLLS